MFVHILLTLPDSFPPSSSWHQMLRKNWNVALVDYLFQAFPCFEYAYGTCVAWKFWFTNEISKRILRHALLTTEWTSSSVLHCNGCCMTTQKYRWRRHGFTIYWENWWKKKNSFLPNYFDPDLWPPGFIQYFNTLRLELHYAWKILKWQCQV